MDCADFKGIYLDKYLDNELSLEETKEFRLHLSECRDCSDFFRGYQELLNLQKAFSSYSPSQISKDKFIRKIKRRKNFPFQVATGLALFMVAFFGGKAFFEYQTINQRYQMIVNKSVQMISSANSTHTNLGPKSAFSEENTDRNKIFELLNDGN